MAEPGLIAFGDGNQGVFAVDPDRVTAIINQKGDGASTQIFVDGVSGLITDEPFYAVLAKINDARQVADGVEIV